MITETNRRVSIVAYYISKFNDDAVRELGYSRMGEAMTDLSRIFGKNNEYLKLRRDEFDVLTGAPRKGFWKRPVQAQVALLHRELKNYTFNEFTEIVRALIRETGDIYVPTPYTSDEQRILTDYTEDEYESIINNPDALSRTRNKYGEKANHVFDTKVQDKLKRLYQFRCQICGATALSTYEIDISEAHHLSYLANEPLDNPKDIVILCPDHHRLIHKSHATFNRETHTFEYSATKSEALQFNLHL